ncbi:PREDICTED: uncharacterized protein LOC104589034 [Nelumbo nucifera]|uniref:Uncharacterized protein LOC104589034 n=2 Tax=Nelumbo nucifera TaxID=4432 RepID=A0A1U7Z442_NELNU|nr:PREDICTED: uncharacterized protein LOC104589034 [Nelumbo nucifera]DAD48503.1 TPA_asm: hypothetical protein HUJ06_018440 [Nelumbo nucifera]
MELNVRRWRTAIVGAMSAAATAAIIICKPRDPTFHLISVNLTSFKLNFPLLDAELTLNVHVINPNIVPVYYSATTMSIFYQDSLLGTAKIEAGSQAAKSCQVLHLPARLDSLELAHHAASFLADVARREMVLDASVDLAGEAKVLWWSHRFNIHAESHVVVDPVFLDVIDQENNSALELFIV